MKIDLYQAFGVDPAASCQDIASRLTAQLAAVHPTNQILRDQILTARQILGDPHRRAGYDRWLRDPQSPPLDEHVLGRMAAPQAGPPPPPARPAPPPARPAPPPARPVPGPGSSARPPRAPRTGLGGKLSGRAALVGAAAVAVTAAIIAGVVVATTGTGSKKDDRAAELVAMATEAWVAENNPDIARRVIGYGKTHTIDLTDPTYHLKGSDSANQTQRDIEQFFRDLVESNRDWTPEVRIKVDNARQLGGDYICLDFEASNNVPDLSVYSGENRDGERWTLPLPSTKTLGIGSRPSISPGSYSADGLFQYVTGDRVVLDHAARLPAVDEVRTGLPGLKYGKARRLANSEVASLTVDMVGEKTEDSIGRLAGGSGEVRDEFPTVVMPDGGSVSMTRCFGRDFFNVDLGGEDGLPESERTGGYILPVDIAAGGRSGRVFVPFAVVD